VSALSGLSGSAGELRMNYMTLLITQLQNQNPLDPMDNGEMASQLAQLSQLELTEELNEKVGQLLDETGGVNSRFDQALLLAQMNEATSMIGKTVSFFPPDSDEAIEAEVTAVDVLDSQICLRAGDYSLGLGAVLSVSD